ncbi:MAG: hypothetical protein ABL921_23380 [Pirellula sp.]
MKFFLQIHARPGQAFSQSFDGLVQLFRNMHGMYVEMDGSFVWIDRETHPHSQMDGMVYDRNGLLEYVEVKGDFSQKQWWSLCQAIGQSAHTEFEIVSDEQLDALMRVHRTLTGDWATVCQITELIAAPL